MKHSTPLQSCKDQRKNSKTQREDDKRHEEKKSKEFSQHNERTKYKNRDYRELNW